MLILISCFDFGHCKYANYLEIFDIFLELFFAFHGSEIFLSIRSLLNNSRK